MAKSKDILGNIHTVTDEAITISIERYDELIIKEALLDKLMVDKDVNVYLYQRIEVAEGVCEA